jgi:L-fuculose-phosphate aldolase
MTTYSQRRTEQQLREEIIRVCHLIWERGWIAATAGNVSARLSENRVLTTPSGFSKGLLQPEQLIIVDMDGRKVPSYDAASRDLRPTSETPMHLEVYRQRPDVQAVVHAHPPISIALSIADIPLARCLLPEVVITLGTIPITRYATPSTPEGAAAVREFIANHDALVLRRHGTVTVGRSPLDAYFKLETVEHSAEITLIVRQLGRSNPISPEEVRKLIEMRRQMGLAHPGEEKDFCAECGVCDLKPIP